MSRLARGIARYRLVIVLVVVVLTGLGGVSLRSIGVNSNFMTFLPSSDGTVRLFDYVDSVYGVGNVLVVGMERSGGVVCESGFSLLDSITRACEGVAGVRKVLSLTNTIDIREEGEGLVIASLYDGHYAWSDSSSRALRDYIERNELYGGRLLSRDGRVAPVLLFLASDADRVEVARVVQSQLLGWAGEGVSLHLAGMPLQQLELTRGVASDLTRLIPIILGVMALILLVSFRSKRGVLLPLATVGVSIVWTLGLMAFCGVSLTPVSASIPVVLFAVGSAYSIHVLNVTRLMEDGSAHRFVVERGLGVVAVPVLLAGLTTVVGFLSFIPGAYLTVIREFGLFMSIGILFCLLLSLTFLPALDSYFRSPRFGVREGRLVAAPAFDWIVGVISRRSGRCIAVLVVLAGLAGLGIMRIGSNIDVLFYFRKDSSMRVSARMLNESLGGTLPVQVVVRGDMGDLGVLGRMEELSDRIERLGGLENPLSVVSLLKRMNGVMGEGYRLPDTQEKLDNLWFMLDGEPSLEQYCLPDRSEGVLHASMRNGASVEYHRVADSLRAWALDLSGDGVWMGVTGIPPIYANFDDNLTGNLYSSLLFACVFVFLCMALLMRSLRMALIGFVPLLVTIVAMFGVMGFLGIALDLATVLIAGVAVGTGIDYSIHFMVGYRTRMRNGLSQGEAIRETLLTSGRGVIFNVVSVASGFLVLLAATLVPLGQFGLLMAITMCISGVSALVLLPSILVYSDSKQFNKRGYEN